MKFDSAGMVAELGNIPTIVRTSGTADDARLRNKSRDYYWYSPILRAALEHVRADLVVLPASEADVVHTLRCCHARRVPVTARGAGTGNYGQAMPLAGGCVLHMKNMSAVRAVSQRSSTSIKGTISERLTM